MLIVKNRFSEMVTKLRPGTVLGTMEFGRGPCNVNVAKEMTESFLNYDTSFRQLDTALMYSGGKSEKIIGRVGCGVNTKLLKSQHIHSQSVVRE